MVSLPVRILILITHGLPSWRPPLSVYPSSVRCIVLAKCIAARPGMEPVAIDKARP